MAAKIYASVVQGSLVVGCSNMLYVLNISQAHGMNTGGLQEVFRAKIVSELNYVSPAWSGFASQLDISKIDIYCTNRIESFKHFNTVPLALMPIMKEID